MRRKLALVAVVILTVSSLVLIRVLQRPPLVDFADSLSQVHLDLKYGGELENRYPVVIQGTRYHLNPEQILYYSARALLILAGRNDEPLMPTDQPLVVASVGVENGGWESYWKKLSRMEYVDLAENVHGEINLAKKAPGTVETRVGAIRFRDALFAFVGALSFYAEHGRLPTSLTVVPVPRGNLFWRDTEIQAEYAYFLLPTRYVVTDSVRIREILAGFQGFETKELARKLSNWVGTNIQAELYVGMRTSEETLTLGRGKCTDYTNLYSALTRAAGIPTRQITGTVIVEEVPAGLWFVGYAPDGRKMAGHAWAETYLPKEGWIPVDPTANRFGENAYEVVTSTAEVWREVLTAHETEYGPIV